MRFDVDPARSRLDIRGSSSVHPIEIRSTKMAGSVVLEGAELRSGELIVPATSLTSGQPLQDLELRRQLQVRRHRSVRAELGRAGDIEGSGCEVAGEVTFLGTTRPAAGALVVERIGEDLRLRGTGSFDVRDFGMEPRRVMGLRVHPDIEVSIDVWFRPAP